MTRLLGAFFVLTVGIGAASQRRVTPVEPCSGSADSAAATALNCLVLIPTPDLAATATGAVALRPAHSPFGVAVTPDGRTRHRLVATVAGLPAPSALGPYAAYVAWAYTLALDSAVKLGPVTNGRVELGELAYAQFRILVSAESSVAVTERGGRLVLRGTSPSARLLAHRDLMQPSSPGALREPAATRGALSMTAAGHGGAHAAAPDGRAAGWAMPPGAPSMPGMHDLVPSVAPFLPSAGARTVRDARPHEVVRLADGDTLTLEAGPVRRTIAGKTFTMYGFNGQHPGPLLEVRQGTTITVRFRNALDEPSAVHWHGLRLDNRSDGAVGLTQDAVMPGGSFTYTLRFPDAGVYWYHPHVREDVQKHLGLYGNMLVRPRRQDYYGAVNREQALMLADLLVDESGAAPFGAEAPTHALMGRFGNVLLVNGEPAYRLDVRRGEVVRFHLTNASSARLLNLSFGAARMKVVAGDLGKFEREEWVTSVVLAPAERYVVDAEFAESGTVALVNRVQALDHMAGSYAATADTLGLVRVSREPVPASQAASFRVLRQNADVSSELAPLRKEFGVPPDRALTLALRTRDLPAAVSNMLLGVNAPLEWNDGMPMMNWATTGREVTWVLRDAATGKENMDVAWRFQQGDLVRVRVFNDPASSHAMHHPIHLHGQRFLVLSRDGVSNANLVWKDSAVIPAGETVVLLVEMSNPGRWMLHCHVAEHLGAGMMMAFTVEPRT